MGQAAQIAADGVIGIALVAQRSDISADDVVEWAANQPVAASKIREAWVRSHGVLLWWAVHSQETAFAILYGRFGSSTER
jgi:hypothetical protein